MKHGSLLPQSPLPLEIAPAPLPRRREFVMGLGALAGSAALLGYDLRSASADPPPETTKIRIHENWINCIAPQIIAQELLHAEGFTDVDYVNYPKDTQHWPPEDLLGGEVDMTFSFSPTDIRFIDAGAPVAILAATHNGCVELVANERVRSTRDLKGKTVGIDTDTQSFISMFVAYVGLDPRRTSTGFPFRRENGCHSLPRGRSTLSCLAPPRRSSCGGRRSGMLWSTRRPTSHGLSILVA